MPLSLHNRRIAVCSHSSRLAHSERLLFRQIPAHTSTARLAPSHTLRGSQVAPGRRLQRCRNQAESMPLELPDSCCQVGKTPGRSDQRRGLGMQFGRRSLPVLNRRRLMCRTCRGRPRRGPSADMPPHKSSPHLSLPSAQGRSDSSAPERSCPEVRAPALPQRPWCVCQASLS